MQITYKDLTIDASSLPEASIAVLLSRGLGHVLGNEVSARVSGYAKKLEITLDPKSVAYEAKRQEFFEAQLAALQAGTIGLRERAATDPFGEAVATIVDREVLSILRAHKLWTGRKHPTDEDAIKFAEGARAYGEIKASWLAKNEAKVHKEATAVLAARERAAAKAAAISETDSATLGF